MLCVLFLHFSLVSLDSVCFMSCSRPDSWAPTPSQELLCSEYLSPQLLILSILISISPIITEFIN